MKIVVGLGNPGTKYEQTRHNAGFIIVEKIADELGLSWETSKKFNARVAKGTDIMLLEPLTYMNLSGQSVASALSYFKLLPKQLGLFAKKDTDLSDTLVVIHDDLDIELGKYKVTTDSRSAGHNGVQSIINHLKTQKFTRYRVGIKTEQLETIRANNTDREAVSRFVLGRFAPPELESISKTAKEIAKETI